MLLKRIKNTRLILRCLFIPIFLLCIVKMYANDSIDENPDEISDYFENVIKTGEMKPLSLLEIADKEKYDLVIAEAVPKLQFLEQQPYENRSFAVRTTRPQGEKLQEPVTK